MRMGWPPYSRSPTRPSIVGAAGNAMTVIVSGGVWMALPPRAISEIRRFIDSWSWAIDTTVARHILPLQQRYANRADPYRLSPDWAVAWMGSSADRRRERVIGPRDARRA